MLKKHFGFTLIELLVVISIIGVLSLIIVPNLMSMRERTRDTKRKSDLTQMKQALRLYYNDNQSYPIDNALFASPGGVFDSSDGSMTYMQTIPEYGSYNDGNGGDSFAMAVTLENGSDSDIAGSQTRCAASITSSGLSITIATDFVICEN